MNKFIVLFQLLMMASVQASQTKTALDLASDSANLVNMLDKDSWLDLYDKSATLDDPVGSITHYKGHKVLSISNFYDAFIGTNNILFQSHLDILVNDDLAIRDVTIHTQTSEGLDLDVPAFVIYERVITTEGAKIKSMKAYWEIPYLLGISLKSGKEGLNTILKMTGRIIKFEKIKGILGFANGLFTTIRWKKQRFFDLLRAFNRGHDSNFLRNSKIFINEKEVDKLKLADSYTPIKTIVSGKYLISHVKVNKKDARIFLIEFSKRKIKSIKIFQK